MNLRKQALTLSSNLYMYGRVHVLSFTTMNSLDHNDVGSHTIPDAIVAKKIYCPNLFLALGMHPHLSRDLVRVMESIAFADAWVSASCSKFPHPLRELPRFHVFTLISLHNKPVIAYYSTDGEGDGFYTSRSRTPSTGPLPPSISLTCITIE